MPEDPSSAHLVTLSTCSYEFENARFVVVGVLTPIDPVAAPPEAANDVPCGRAQALPQLFYPIVHRKFTRPAPAGIDNNGQTVYN